MLRLGLLVAIVLTAGAACGGGSAEPTPVQTEVPASPTVQALTTTPQPAGSSTPDSGAVTRNALPARLAATAGRIDCPDGWLVYEAPAFTSCYPPEHYAETWSMEGSPLYFSVRLITGLPVAYTPFVMDVWAAPAYAPPTECLFEAEAVDLSAESSLAGYEIAGATGIACTARAAYAIQFKGGAPASFGALQFSVYAQTDAQLELAKSILSTVRLVPAEPTSP